MSAHNTAPEGSRFFRTAQRIFMGLCVAALATFALLVFLSPLGREHITARQAVCLSNLKTCWKCLIMYTADYDGYLPSSALVTHSLTWNKGDFVRFATRRGAPGPHGRPVTWADLFWHYTDENTFFCPSDPSDQKQPNGVVSYWWKTALDKAWYGVGCSRTYRRETDFTHAADCIFVYERNGWHEDQFPGLRNGTRINVAYLDGHTKTIELANATSGDPINCAANRDGEPMYFNYNIRTKRSLPKRTPATYTDPACYCDRLECRSE